MPSKKEPKRPKKPTTRLPLPERAPQPHRDRRYEAEKYAARQKVNLDKEEIDDLNAREDEDESEY